MNHRVVEGKPTFFFLQNNNQKNQLDVPYGLMD